MGHAATKPDKVNIWIHELKMADVAEKSTNTFVLMAQLWLRHKIINHSTLIIIIMANITEILTSLYRIISIEK